MASRITETEMKLWTDRSAHADHIWQEKGLTSFTPGKWGETSIFTHMDAYRSNQWETIGMLRGIAAEAHLVINAVFSTLNTLQAQLLARNPRANVTARNPDVNGQFARPFEILLNYLIGEAKLSRAWNAAMRDAFYRVGFVRVGYTPLDETIAKGKRIERGPTMLDVPWMRRVAPWDIRIDPIAESWHADADARWCEFISVMTMEEIKANPGMIVPRDLKATISKDKRQRDERRVNNPYQGEAANLVEVRTVYDQVERKWFQWSPGSEKPLREPDDWPDSLQGCEGLPYAMLAFNEQSDDPCPLGFADVLWPLQVERNKVRTILNELTKRMRRIIVANGGAFADEDKNKIADSDLVELLFTNGSPAREAIAEVGIAGFDQTLLLYDQMIQTDIREVLGQSQMARAQRINVTSATEAAAVAQGDSMLTARNQRTVEEWLRDSLRLYAKAVQGSMTDDIVIPVVGEQDTAGLMAGTSPVLRVEPKQIQGEFMFEIEVGSTLPKNEQMEKMEAMAWLQAIAQFPQNANIPDALRNLALAFNRDPSKALMNADQIAATNQNLMGQPQVEPGRQGGGLNPAAFLGSEGVQ